MRKIALWTLGLLLTCAAACDNKKKDDPKPRSSHLQLLLGNGEKRWHFQARGSVKLPNPVNLNQALSEDVPLTEYSDCEKDDALVFRTDYTMDYWHGSEACGEYDYTNVMIDWAGWWYLYLEQQSILTSTWTAAEETWHIAELTETRLRVRIVDPPTDSLTQVFEMVFESQP